MSSQPNSESSGPIVRGSAPSNHSDLRPAQRLARGTRDLLDGAGDRLETLSRHGLDAVRRRSLRLQDQALHASDSTLHYIRGEPVKAVLIAAAAGAALLALLSLLIPARSRD